MKAMILAAGRGTRMAPLTDNCPKPLIALAGKPLIVHHIEKLVAAGITDLVINHAYLGHMIEQYLGDGSQYGARIQYSPETEALETGGGIFNALPLLGNEPFLLVNGDVWTDWNYAEALALNLGQDLVHLWLVPNPPQHPNGDFGLAAGRVLNPHSQTQPITPTYTFSGLSLIHPHLFNNCSNGVFPLAPLLRTAMDAQRAGGAVISEHWVDVGTPERLAQLEAQLGAE